MKKFWFVIYSWGSTSLYVLFICWLATLPNLTAGVGVADETIKILYKLVLSAILFILFYRSMIVTLKTTVGRLSAWRSKQEQIEDEQFVLIIETLVTIIAVLGSVIIMAFYEYLQSSLNISGRHGTLTGVLIGTLGILLTAIVVYSTPVIGELEVALKAKFDNLLRKIKPRNSK